MEEIEALLETGAVAAVEIAASSLAERGAAPVICPNCNKPLIGPYCAVCGQPHNTTGAASATCCTISSRISSVSTAASCARHGRC